MWGTPLARLRPAEAKHAESWLGKAEPTLQRKGTRSGGVNGRASLGQILDDSFGNRHLDARLRRPAQQRSAERVDLGLAARRLIALHGGLHRPRRLLDECEIEQGIDKDLKPRSFAIPGVEIRENVDIERLIEGVLHAGDDRVDVLLVVDVLEKDREFVAAKPRH